MGDWEDEMWDYGQDFGQDFGQEFGEEEYGREEKDDGEEEWEEDEKEFDEGEETMEDVPEAGEDIEFVQDYKQLQQTSHERRSTLGTAGEGFQKSQRSPEEATIDQVEGVISSTYSDISDLTRQKIITKLESLKRVQHYHVETLVLAAIWSVEGKILNKKNLQDFLTKYKNRADVNILDLVRYMRILTLK